MTTVPVGQVKLEPHAETLGLFRPVDPPTTPHHTPKIPTSDDHTVSSRGPLGECWGVSDSKRFLSALGLGLRVWCLWGRFRIEGERFARLEHSAWDLRQGLTLWGSQGDILLVGFLV